MRRSLRSWLWRVPVAQEVDEEIAHHVELRTQELTARGMDPADARAEAIRRLGDPARLASQLRALGDARDRRIQLRQWAADLLLDARLTLRHARHAPMFTLGVVLTLALGLGATTSIFSAVHAVLLAPFPYDEPDRVLSVHTTWRGRPGNTSAGNFEYLRQRVTTLAPLAAAGFTSVNLAGDDQPERIVALRTTASWFDVFGVAPTLGRAFTAEEDQPGQAKVAVLGHGLWQRRFGGRPDVLGQTIRLSDEPFTIVGVMPAAFEVVMDGAEVLVPIAFTAERLAMHDEHFLDLYGRRRAGVLQTQVNEELSRVAEGLRRDHARDNVDRGAESQRLDRAIVGDYRLRLIVLLAAVGLVLAIACVNAANLLLARLAVRSRELAVRAALGAGRGRIVRQVLAESLVLALAGGAGGVLVAWWALPVLVALAPDGVPRLGTATLNGPVMAMSLALAIGSAVVVGLLPAWFATARTRRQELSDGKGVSTGTLHPRVRQALIGAQAALVVVVLTGAILLVRSAINLQQVPIGIDTTGVLRARVGLPAAQYQSPTEVKAWFERLLETLATSPGVAAVAMDSQTPLFAVTGSNGVIPEGKPLGMESVINSRTHFVTPDYFRVLQQTLRAGRPFAAGDIREAPLVTIVNETLARAAFPGQDPIGKRISCCEGELGKPSWKVVVGVVADVRSRGPAVDPVPEFYLPLAQIPPVAWGWVNNTLDVLVRPSTGDPIALAGTIRQAVRSLDASLPVFGIRTLDEGLRTTLAQARFNTLLMSLLAFAALVLAALGIYSVVAWLVAQRTREIGLRMALGASPGQVVRQVVGHGLRPVTVGAAVGLLAAAGTTGLLRGQLFQVSPYDPVTFAVVALVLIGVALVAILVPARRATAIDPARALHDA